MIWSTKNDFKIEFARKLAEAEFGNPSFLGKENSWKPNYYCKIIIYFVEHFVPSFTFAEKLFLVLHGREFKGYKLKTQNEHVRNQNEQARNDYRLLVSNSFLCKR